MTFGLVLAGGLVTSRDAGLAVPDWPLSYGQLNPPRWYAIENVRTEHGHRLLAVCVATITAVLGIGILRHEKRIYVRILGLAAIGTVLLQALLGGLRVLQLSVNLAMLHGWTGQLFFMVLAAIATVTAPSWTDEGPAETPAAFGRTALGLAVAVLLQLMVGIAMRHGALSAPVFLSPVLYLHLGLALIIVMLAYRLGGRKALAAPSVLKKSASWLPRVVGLQLALGGASLVLTTGMKQYSQASFLEAWLPSLHVATGAAILGLSVVVLLHGTRGRIASRGSLVLGSVS